MDLTPSGDLLSTEEVLRLVRRLREAAAGGGCGRRPRWGSSAPGLWASLGTTQCRLWLWRLPAYNCGRAACQVPARSACRLRWPP